MGKIAGMAGVKMLDNSGFDIINIFLYLVIVVLVVVLINLVISQRDRDKKFHAALNSQGATMNQPENNEQQSQASHNITSYSASSSELSSTHSAGDSERKRRYCSNCGGKISNNEIFCHSCGAKLE